MPQRVRKIPIRTCVVCQQSCNKKELIRIIRTPAGTVEMDPTGKRSGRGAYLCSRSECRTGPQAAQRLSRALQTPVKGDLIAAWFAES
ncbi:MAG: YlxR family protein [Armatimonadota bacterium]|nr:YlxR family protein [Armatimonadota bacterium]